MDIKVAIFEDNPLLRDSLFQLINGSEGFVCTGAFPDCTDLMRKVESADPDVILMDIDLPGGMNGIEAVGIINQKHPGIMVIMQTVFNDNERIFQSITAGASGYIVKNTEPSRVIQAIREVAQGGAFFTPSIAKKVLQSFQQQAKAEYTQLTGREKDVLQLLVEGLSYKMIAARLDIGFGTVHTHIKNIYEKLHVNSASEAVAKAIRQRLV